MQGETGVFQTSRAPALHDGADHPKVKKQVVSDKNLINV